MYTCLFGLVMFGAVFAAPTTRPTPEASSSLQTPIVSLLTTMDELKYWGDKAQSYIDTTLTQTEMTELEEKLIKILKQYQEVNYNLDTILSTEKGIDEDILKPEDLTEKYMSVISEELEQYDVDNKEKLSMVLGDRFGAQGVRMRILTGLLHRMMERINELVNLIAQISSVQETDGDIVVLANLLVDLEIDLAVLDGVFTKMGEIFAEMGHEMTTDDVTTTTTFINSDDVTETTEMPEVMDTTDSSVNGDDKTDEDDTNDVITRNRRSTQPREERKSGGWGFDSRGLSYTRGRTSVSVGPLSNPRSKTDYGGQVGVSIRW